MKKINNISIMSLNDLEIIKNNLEKDFDDFWNYNILKNELNNSNSIYFSLKNNMELIGFVGISIVIDEADITNIVIKKQYRGQRFFKNSFDIFNKLLSN